MNLAIKKFAWPALSVIGLFAASQSYADLVVTANSSDSDGALVAQADFSLVGDVLTIQLTSLVGIPQISSGNLSVGEEVSGIEFNVTGGGSSTLNGSSGNIANISGSTGAYMPTGVSPIPMWGVTGSTGSYNLSVFTGGSPEYMIIGPDSAGGFSGAGTYPNIAGVSQHNPTVLGTGTFTVTVAGISNLTQISDIKIEFGTGPDATVTTTTRNTPVPEPTTIISGALMLVPLSVQLIRKMRKGRQEA